MLDVGKDQFVPATVLITCAKMGAAYMPSANTHVEAIVFCILHLTAIVTAGLVCPATLTTTGTVSPVVIPAGTTALIWYNPAYPGVRPAKASWAALPPIITVTAFTVVVKGAGDPAATAGVTAPNPVQ
jgi:hypothetical protein